MIDPACSRDKKAVQKRTVTEVDEYGDVREVKRSYGETFIRNQINVLLTRGVNGLYLYAVDDELRTALKNAVTLE